MEKIIENKRLKIKSLFDAAYDLFTTKGIQETVIDDIVKKAGVAKGTFYLYFKDKYDLIDKMVIRKSSTLMETTLKTVEIRAEKENLDFESSVILFIDYLIEHFKDNKELLSVIYKNLSWGLYKEALSINEMNTAAQLFISKFKETGGDIQKAEKTLYLIVEMTGSICYSAIVMEEPYTIEEIKPILYSSIKKILN